MEASARAFIRERQSGNPRAIDRLFQEWRHLAALAVLDGVEPEYAARLPDLGKFEIARFDKQTGGGATNAATTSIVDKAGIPGWLAVALERGAVSESLSTTGATFSTSAHMLLSAMFADALSGESDVLRDIGVSASFPLTPGAAPQANSDQISDWSLRWKVLGGRSTLARAYDRIWGDSLRSALQQTADAEALFSVTPYEAIRADADRAKDVVRVLVGDLPLDEAATPAAAAEMVASRVIQVLDSQITQPVRSGLLLPKSTDRDAVLSAARGMGEAQRVWGRMRTNALERLKERAASQTLTMEFLDHRRDLGQDWCEGTLIYLRKVTNLDLTLNAGASFFRDRRAVLRDENRRGLSVALSLEGKRRNPFSRAENDSPTMPVSIDGRLEWPKDAAQHIAVLQIRTEIPVATGASLPLSVSWANRSAVIKESQVRAHFGFTIDADKLLAISHIGAGLH